jgi:hypothetical protein
VSRRRLNIIKFTELTFPLFFVWLIQFDGLLSFTKFLFSRKNLILTNVVEERWVDSSDYSTATQEKVLASRQLSQAMIPGSRLMKVEIDESLYNAAE